MVEEEIKIDIKLKALFRAGRGGGEVRLKKKVKVDNAIVGCWQYQNTKIELSANGYLYKFIGPTMYSISQDGNALTFDGMTLQRYQGNGNTIVGVWRGTEGGEPIEIHFRQDYTYLWRWLSYAEDWPGYYSTTSNYLTIREQRASYSVSGSQVVLSVLNNGGTVTCDYTVSQSELRLTCDGQTTTCQKASCK